MAAFATKIELRFALPLALAFVIASSAACHGGTFQLEGPIASAPALPVRGDLGLQGCAEHETLTGLAAGARASVALGGLHLVAGAPHRNVTTRMMFSDAVLKDYEMFVSVLQLPALAAQVKAARERSDHAVEHDPGVVGGLGTLGALVGLPASTTETTAFTFAGKEGERAVLGACRTTMIARTFGALDDPRFSMTCRVVTMSDGTVYDLRVHGEGTWANFAFRGALAGSRGQRFVFGSQNVSIMGAGAIRGFDLRSASGQVAAVSFWQTARRGEDGADPAAWVLPQRTQGETDVLTATMALAYLFPWPTSCDVQRLRQEGAGSG